MSNSSQYTTYAHNNQKFEHNFRVFQFLEIPTLFCQNSLNDGLQNFLTGQKLCHLCKKKLSEGVTACLFHLPLQAIVATITELKARADTIFCNSEKSNDGNPRKFSEKHSQSVTAESENG